MKSKFQKEKSRIIHYTSIKNNPTGFKESLGSKLSSCKSYEQFEQVFLDVVDKAAPLKNKAIRANQAPYMTKSLRKAIISLIE